MNYRYDDGQIRLPEDVTERGGMQPVVKAAVSDAAGNSTCDGKVVQVKAGEPVSFHAVVTVLPEAGKVTKAAWDYEKTNDWSVGEELHVREDGSVLVESTHVFAKPGVYYPCIKVQSNRNGDLSDIFTQCKNLDRVKVVVGE